MSGRENIPGLKILSSVENVAKQEIQPYIVSTLDFGNWYCQTTDKATHEQWKENFKSKGHGKKKKNSKLKRQNKKKKKKPKNQKKSMFIRQTCKMAQINTQFMTKMTEKPYPLGATHTYIAHIREVPTPGLKYLYIYISNESFPVFL